MSEKTDVSVRPVNILVGIIFTCIFLSIMTLMGLTIFMQENICDGTPVNGIDYLIKMVCWFDPVFMIYNLLMLLMLVMIVPIITLSYVHTMRARKEERLQQQIPQNEKNIKKIKCCLDETFDMNYYAGSMTLLSIVIMLGGMIILIVKPMAMTDSGNSIGFGVDYSKGANFLMLGSYMHYFIEGNMKDYMRALTGTLTAFQFGFLGAYVYFITHLVRSYFTLDLSPNIYISCTIRIILGSVLSLIMSFAIITGYTPNADTSHAASQNNIETISSVITTSVKPAIDSDNTLPEKHLDEAGLNMSNSYYYLPMLSFFIGFFPLRGLLLIERFAGSLLQILPEKYQSTSLSNLTGMSYQHEMRLNREGFDNVENLVSADITSLCFRTGFAYQQLENWYSEAELVALLGNDYARFRQATGINSREALIKNSNLFAHNSNDNELKTVIDETLYQKTRIILNTIS